jgi:GDPmannose 4,6-dehydratase
MRVLITGVTGQDGPYLAAQLGAAGHFVYGLVRGQLSPKWADACEQVSGLRLIRGDLLDQASLQAALIESRPEVVYNLAALSFVGTSWTQPVVTAEVTGLGTLRLLDAIRFVDPEIRFVQASSSEMFGDVAHSMAKYSGTQDELTPFAPRSPYAFAKVFAHQATINYRESYDMHASTAIMFNHESPRRGQEFVTRKVTRAVARIKAGKQDELLLGRLEPQRDWGWAPDYMRALPLIAGKVYPGDYVLATGQSRSVRDWCDAAFHVADLDWSKYVKSDKRYYRPAEVGYLCGDAAKAKRELGWQPTTGFHDIVRQMVTADLEAER